MMPTNKDHDDDLGKLLGQQIAAHRRALNLTQLQLAELLGVEPETISRFERGTSLPSLKRLNTSAGLAHRFMRSGSKMRVSSSGVKGLRLDFIRCFLPTSRFSTGLSASFLIVVLYTCPMTSV